jgi:hypothetical protein
MTSVSIAPWFPAQDRSFFSYAASSFEECSIRIENIVSKYFLEYLEPLSPQNVFSSVVFVIQSIYTEVDKILFWRWFEPFKAQVGSATTLLYDGELTCDTAFYESREYETLKKRFPFIYSWKEKGVEWLNLADGACLGESLALMKGHLHFDGLCSMPLGFKTEAIFFQALHQLQFLFKEALALQKNLEQNNISQMDFQSAKGPIDPDRLFHYLRLVGASRRAARIFSETFPELFLLDSNVLQGSIELGDWEARCAYPLWLDMEKFSDESDDKACDFFCNNPGVFTLIACGERGAGHAMFVKVEGGQCHTFDPMTRTSFSTYSTKQGVAKTLELIKRIVTIFNGRDRISYRVMGLDLC